jgi:tetratricopeptide (TPR) repeat protein
MKKAPLLALALITTVLSAQEETAEPLQPANQSPEQEAGAESPAPAPESDQVVPVADDPDAEEAAAEPLPPAPEMDQVVPVADDPTAAEAMLDESVTVAMPTFETDEEELIYQYERYIELMKDRVYDEADSVAKRVVELAIKVKGPDSTDFAKALTNLAIVQHRTEQYDASQQNFEAAIEIIENNEDQLDEQLVNPLRGLGASQLESGRPDKATDTFGRAVHVTHVNMGPHNLEQIGILESLSESMLRLGSVDDAKEIQDRIYSLNERAYANNAMEMVPSLMRRADWQHRAGFINDERTTLRRAIRIIEQGAGKDDMSLVEPLTRLGQSYFFIDLSGSAATTMGTVATGESHFKRALRIAHTDPNANWKLIAETSLALGDYYNFLENMQQAHKVYRAAWQDLSTGEERLQFRRENLEQWVVLRENPFPRFVTPPSADRPAGQRVPLAEGTITLSYDVSTQGRAVNLQIIEAQPREFVDLHRNVQRQLRKRIYRPRYADGVAVETSEQIVVHKYFFDQAELDALRASADESEET